MQAEEGTSMAKMVVQILLVILLIAAVVGLVYGAYNWFTSGSDKMTGQISSIDKSSLSQYDNQQVPGASVLSALKSYADSDMAVFICTTNSQNSGKTPAYEAAETAASATAANYCVLCTTKDNKAPAENANVSGDSSSTKYYQYPVKLAKNDVNNVPSNCWYVETVYWGKGNSVQRNSNFSITTDKSANKTYVKQSSDFYSNLVYDASTGDICGLLFRQMN